MKVSRICFAAVLVAALAACGGGNHPPDPEHPELPPQTPRHARHAPIVDLDGKLHVGADVAAPADGLPLVARHGDVDVSHGTIRDGVGAARLTAYLKADAAAYRSPEQEDVADTLPFPDGLVFRFMTVPPAVRIAAGTPPELLDETVRVVQAINAALPTAWRLRFSGEPAPAGSQEPSYGEILVTFAPQEDWPAGAASPGEEEVGLAEPLYTITRTGNPETPWSIDIFAGRIWVDPSRTAGRERLGVIAHELIHLLGRSHVDPERFPDTLMVAGGSEELSAHILHPLDREALLAVYGRLDSGTLPHLVPERLGPWSDASMHVRGSLVTEEGEVGFGAALRNGLSQPWAAGPAPRSNLGENAALSGSVRWSGRLLGLTPDAAAVAGAAGLTVDLATLSGSMDFSELESWPADTAPGAAGTGTAWRHGRLNYQVRVRGNSFVQTGGDAGEVTGAFFGTAHEGMGGVLVRDDLSAGYGGKR